MLLFSTPHVSRWRDTRHVIQSTTLLVQSRVWCLQPNTWCIRSKSLFSRPTCMLAFSCPRVSRSRATYHVIQSATLATFQSSVHIYHINRYSSCDQFKDHITFYCNMHVIGPPSLVTFKCWVHLYSIRYHCLVTRALDNAPGYVVYHQTRDVSGPLVCFRDLLVCWHFPAPSVHQYVNSHYTSRE